MCSSQGPCARAVALIKYCDKQNQEPDLVPKRAPGVHVKRIADWTILEQHSALAPLGRKLMAPLTLDHGLACAVRLRK